MKFSSFRLPPSSLMLVPMEEVQIPIRRVRRSNDSLTLPAYMTEGSAGMDLAADLEADVVLAPLERTLIPTGIAIALPLGFEAQIRPRSGLALKKGITLLNSPGTIDSDYRGEIGVVLINFGSEPFTVRDGERIAQMVIAPVTRAAVKEVDVLPASVRGTGGFGHTGV